MNDYIKVSGKLLKALYGFACQLKDDKPNFRKSLSSIWYSAKEKAFYATDSFVLARMRIIDDVDLGQDDFFIDPELFDRLKTSDEVVVNKDKCVIGKWSISHETVEDFGNPPTSVKSLIDETKNAEWKESAFNPDLMKKVINLASAAYRNPFILQKGIHPYFKYEIKQNGKSENVLFDIDAIVMPVRIA